MEDESRKGTLTTQVYLQLRRDVLSGVLEPGRKLRIEELARAYGSGSSPVREALSLLASDGLVERLEQRGFKVRPVDEAEFVDILQMRCWAEERALRESIALYFTPPFPTTIPKLRTVEVWIDAAWATASS